MAIICVPMSRSIFCDLKALRVSRSLSLPAMESASTRATRAVAVRTPALVPWAWGINSFFTVIGTVTSLMVAMTFGFTVAIGGAVACYLLAASLAGDPSVA